MFSQALRSTTYRLVLAVVVLGLGVFFGARLTGMVWAASELQAKNVSPSTTADHRQFTCQPFDIYEEGDAKGIYIGCVPGDGAITLFFQSYTSDPKRAARILSMAMNAKAMGKTLTMSYDLADLSCGDICRPIITMRLDN
ncbi:MAG: hypothetical protein U0350_32455 [Caldilineaceae bacterium]